MMLNKKCPIFVRFLMITALLFSIFGCANQQRPQGGPRDVTPPVLLKATPANMTRHFAAKSIELEFDEFFKLNNQYQEIVLSPAQDKQPDYKIRKKTLVITFKDSLQKNTTYVLNFGKAIQDVNEGNTVKNFTYVFSTGEHIDSLSVSGSVTNTVTQLKEKDITVMLFALKDSLLFGKKKPTIFTTTDTSGNFSLNNLKEGDYRIYALKETAPNKIYDRDDELIAFLKQPIHLSSDTSNIQLNLFKEDPAKFRVTEKRFDVDGKIVMLFNKQLTQPSFKIVYPEALDNQKYYDFSRTKDTAYLFMRNMDFDSLRVAILDKGKPIDSVSLRKGRKESFKRVLDLTPGVNNILNPNNTLSITATMPIENYDGSLVSLLEDSVAVSGVTITRDTSSSRKFQLKYRWKPDSKYQLVIDDGAFTDIYGDKNKKLLKRFTVDKVENYSTLTLKVTVPDTAKAYVLEIFQDPKNILRRDELTKNSTFVYKNFLTGKYHIRVVYDTNRNGKWDSGNVKKRLYPENIWVDPQEITLRPNWDSEEKRTIPKENVTQ